ncbi:MAG: hypothetical protein OIF47_12740 [Marinibacterium sp.]|nr:hypothetical protein [Marinibacterium sp.]
MADLTPKLALAAMLTVAVFGPQARAETQYLDDRSTPQTLVQSYYDAINKQQYARAYGYFTPDAAPADFASWSAGYAKTKSVSVQFGPTQPDPGAGQIFWALPVAISALGTDGQTSVFAGCYTIHLTNPGMQMDPPFQPMSIQSAHLSPSDQPIHSAVPQSCD